MSNWSALNKIYYSRAVKDIEQSKMAPAYLLFGEEILLGDNLINQIKKEFLDEVEPELNFYVRYATDGGADALLSLSSGLGLFADKKIILLKEAQALSQKDIDKIAKFLKNQPKEICIIFHSPVSSIYQTRLKKLGNIVTTVQLLPLRHQELIAFVKNEVAKHKLEITAEATELLIFFVGNQLTDLVVQLNTIIQNVGEKARIEENDIQKITGIYVNQTVFELCDYIGNRQLEKAVFVMRNLLDSGISPQQILAQLIRHFNLIWQIKGFERSGIRSADVIAKNLKIFPKYFQNYAKQARKWELKHLKTVIFLLTDADKELKNSKKPTKLILDILNYEIINC